jgi:hypothetical protein
MISSKYQKIGYTLLACLGAGYFLAFSQIDTPFPFLKIYAAMIPAQLGALIYVAWVIRKRNLDKP